MGKDEVGRNDPCPCGSGLKYKKCCLGRQDAPEPSGKAQDILTELKQAIQEQHFATIDEAQAFINEYTTRKNRQPLDEFQGLSSEQMSKFLYYPFDSPDVVQFPSVLDVPPSAPIVTLFGMLADAIGEKGLKPTATGNLPRKLVQESALAFWGEEKYQENMRYMSIRSETDFSNLHVTRIVAELAGLMRKYKGKFILSRDCRKLLDTEGMAGIYPRLLQTFTRKYNWGYGDRYPEMDFIQQSFLYSLYLLHRFGDEWRPNSFYEDAFLLAFPQVVDLAGPVYYTTPEQKVRDCYSLRVLQRFAAFVGLVEMQTEPGDIFIRHFQVKKLPLLDQAVRFGI